MDNNQKMLPSILSKSTELTKINQSSTELCRMQYSREIVQAKSNIIRANSNVTRAKSNIAGAKPNIRPISNGGGGGGGSDDGRRGPKGGDDGSANDPGEYFRTSAETSREFDPQKQKELLSALGKIILVILAIQLLLGIVNTIFHLLAQFSSFFLIFIACVIGFFLAKTYGCVLFKKDSKVMKNIKTLQAQALNYTRSKFKAFPLNIWNKNKCAMVKLKTQTYNNHNS